MNPNELTTAEVNPKELNIKEEEYLPREIKLIVAYFPRPGTADEQKTVYPSLRVRDGSFIKIKNITLGYTLPANISRKVLMEKCRIYATAYNPFIFVKDKQLKDTDPETNGSDAFPTYRQFVFGVNLTF